MLSKIFIAAVLSSGLLYTEEVDPKAIGQKIQAQNISVVKAAAEGLSRTLPQKVDKFTALTAIDADGERLIYTYTIDDPKHSDEEIAKMGKEKMRLPVTRGICTSSHRFLQSGIAIRYRYISAGSKKELFRFDVSRKDCEPF